MRGLALLLLVLPLAAAASAPLAPEVPPINQQLKVARAEAVAAETEAKRLGQIADRARDAATKLRAQQLSAAQAIAASEARITAADAELRVIAAAIAERRTRLEHQQRPAAALLAGLAVMAQRPPLLAVADEGSTDDFVEVRLLLDSTLPVIRRRTAALSAELEQGRKFAQAAREARARLAVSRDELTARKTEFAALETRALREAERTGGRALAIGDVALSAGETVEELTTRAAETRQARSIATELAAAVPAPPRPMSGEGTPQRPQLAYRLPSEAAVSDGLAAVSTSGVRSRGLKLATARGSALIVPASGVVKFAGPYRSHDGIVIIDHGRGWVSLIVNASTTFKVGQRVRIGEPLGRALGPIGLELSHNGQRVSPALIAGSSQTLSKAGKDG